MASYLEDNNKQHCSGCSACANVCAHKAISMKEDGDGFLFPDIDDSKCIHCNLCVKTCPFEKDQANQPGAQHTYVAITKNQYYYKTSATIGVCTMLADKVLEQNGFVFGVTLDEREWKARHIEVSNKEGLERIRNSKYLQSDLGKTFAEVKNHLLNNNLVLYVGTPCQIAGLKSYLKKEYENLITVDIICHGVFSPKLLKYEVDYWEKLFHSKIHNLRFRSKRVYKANVGNVNFDLEDGKHIERYAASSPTYRCFAYAGDGKNYNLRLSCYECQFRSSTRYGDISVGDPWYVDWNIIKEKTIKQFVGAKTIFSANTEKGEKLIRQVLAEMVYDELPHEQLFCQPAVLPAKREVPALRAAIYENLDKEDYGHLIERMFNCDLESEHQKFDRNYRRNKRLDAIKKYTGARMLKSIIRRIYGFIHKTHIGFQWWWLNVVMCYFPSVHLRRAAYRLAGMKISKNVRFFEGVHVRNPKGIQMGDGCSIGTRVLLDGRMGLTVGKSVVFGYECIIWTLNHDYNDTNFCTKGAPVTIGDYAWICSRSIVLPGITIGEGAVVASCAIVTKDVPPYAIVAGIPAKVVGQREKKNYMYGYKSSEEYMHII